MLCRYWYYLGTCKRCGFYEADLRDAKKIFNKLRDEEDLVAFYIATKNLNTGNTDVWEWFCLSERWSKMECTDKDLRILEIGG